MIDAPEAMTPSVFTARGFLDEMRRRGSGAGEAASLTASGSLLAPETLEEYPDPALAWITGIYAVAVGRRPDPVILRKHVQNLRDGAAPDEILDAVLALPEAAASRTRKRPDLRETFVTGAYLVALRRVPDVSGLAAHLLALDNGMSEAQLLKHLLGAEEAQSQFRFPPPPVDEADLLARTIQTIGLGTRPTPETTSWAQEALDRGVPARQVVRSLARRLHGRSPAALFVALTARPRAAAARRAAHLGILQEELLRERLWQWQLQRATWQRLDRLEALAGADRPAPAYDLDEGTPPA
jgi:hypothetical protein